MENSPLNRLPSEIRLDIFEYVFSYEGPIHKAGLWIVTPKRERRRRFLYNELAPTLVCKQMRNETLHLPLLLNNLSCGNQLGDFDPYYAWWVTPALKDPCQWALNALRKMIPAFLSDSTTLEMHLRVFSRMTQPRESSSTDWNEVCNIFKALVGALGPVKLVIYLHFQFHFSSISCDCEGLGPLRTHNGTMLNICPGDPSVARKSIKGLADAIGDSRWEIRQHRNHPWRACSVNTQMNALFEQLAQAEQMARRFIDIATLASLPEARPLQICTSPGIDEAFAGPSNSQNSKRDSTQSKDEEAEPSAK